MLVLTPEAKDDATLSVRIANHVCKALLSAFVVSVTCLAPYDFAYMGNSLKLGTKL